MVSYIKLAVPRVRITEIRTQRRDSFLLSLRLRKTPSRRKRLDNWLEEAMSIVVEKRIQLLFSSLKIVCFGTCHGWSVSFQRSSLPTTCSPLSPAPPRTTRHTCHTSALATLGRLLAQCQRIGRKRAAGALSSPALPLAVSTVASRCRWTRCRRRCS